MEDTHCVVPRLDVPLPADCPCSAADSQLPAPLVRASSELSPTSSLLNFQDSPAPRPDDAPPRLGAFAGSLFAFFFFSSFFSSFLA